MEITVVDQLLILLYSLVCGLGLGLLFDLFRIMRRITKPGLVATGLQDIIFWLIAAAVVFLSLYTYNSGELRLFEFIGIFAAGFLYNLTFSKFVVNAGVAIYGAVSAAAMWIIKIILLPVAFVYKLLRKPLLVVVGTAGRGARKYRRIKRGYLHKFNTSVKNFGKIFKKV